MPESKHPFAISARHALCRMSYPTRIHDHDQCVYAAGALRKPGSNCPAQDAVWPYSVYLLDHDEMGDDANHPPDHRVVNLDYFCLMMAETESSQCVLLFAHRITTAANLLDP